MVDDVVVIQPGDERAQKIARAMASQTANAIIQAFGGGPLTSSEVARQMKIPITTASYHIENLLDAGLLEVMQTRWSEKGREVKVYGLANQVLIIASPVLPPSWGVPPAPRAVIENGEKFSGAGEDVSTLQAPTFDAAGVPPVHDLVMGFFFGACAVLLALLVYEVYYWWRTSPRCRVEKEQERIEEVT